MRTTRSSQAPARKALWLTGLLLTLAGLVAMHGLGGHGLPGATHDMAAVMVGHPAPPLTDPGATATPTMADPAHGAAAAVSMAVHGVPALVAQAAATARNAELDHSDLMAMCVAILAAAFVALLRRLAAAQTITGLPRTSEPTRTWTQFRGRDPDPPSMTVLSIRRC